MNPLPNGRVGVPYSFSFCTPPVAGSTDLCNPSGPGANPSNGQGPYHFQLDTAGGFPPTGLSLGLNGLLSGTPSVAVNTRVFTPCAVDLSATSVCHATALTIVDDITGNWQGQFNTQSPCPTVPAQAGTWRATVTLNGLNVSIRWFDTYHQQVLTTTTTLSNGRTIAFTVGVGDDSVQLNGTFAANGRSIAGQLTGPLVDRFCSRANGVWTGTPGGPGA